VRPQLCEINHSSAIWLHSFVFLLVFSICRQGLSLLGEVDRATPVDNQRSRGAVIAGFRAELFGSRIELCRDSTKSRVIRTFRKIGNPSSHQGAQAQPPALLVKAVARQASKGAATPQVP
jgi:hypothetical protein